MTPTALEFTCCATRELPADLKLAAAWQAAEIRPENAPGLVHLALTHPPDRPFPDHQAITLQRSKFWRTGSVLKVAFRSATTNQAVFHRIVQYANRWSRFANLAFVRWQAGQVPDIVVGFEPSGYWSVLGTDALPLARQGQTTLNLQGFDTDPLPDSEWDRVVGHEFGHALGAWHEHLRREIVARIDPDLAYDFFARTQGWSAEVTRRNVLTPIEEGSDFLSSPVEETSLMAYALPAAIMRDRRPVAGGTDITPTDGLFVGKAYPGRAPVHPRLAGLGDPHPQLADLLVTTDFPVA